MKTKVCLIVDELLHDGVPFECIMKITGWTKQEIFDYMRSSFIEKYPSVYEKNVAYFTWGMTNKQLERYNKTSQEQYISSQMEKLYKEKMSDLIDGKTR